MQMDRFFHGLLANGFLPTRGTWMLDFVVVAMVLVSLGLIVSLYQVRIRKNFQAHRAIQIYLGAALAVTLVAFEIDIRFYSNWREPAAESVFYNNGWVDLSLWIHLAFAIPTPFIWIFLIGVSIYRFDQKFGPANFRTFHRWMGRLAVAMMFATAITGWFFYWLAFVA